MTEAFRFLGAPEVRFVEAAVERLIPTDRHGPGARDAGVVAFIDGQLAGPRGSHTRMGADPATSVVDRYLQSWDAPNVFVVGASAFPQDGANPSTPTVGALTCWTVDAIEESYLHRPGPLV